MEKEKFYNLLALQCDALLENESDLIANSANFSALLADNLEDINWCGFYFLKDQELVLGPFQGKVACVRIAIGKGVCGSSAATRKTFLVEDVHKFEGHIACDSASKSEIVIPLVKDDQLIGVLDIDSPNIGRFDLQDQKGLERLAQIFLQQTSIDSI